MGRGINAKSLARFNEYYGSPLFVLRGTYDGDGGSIIAPANLRIIDVVATATAAGGGSGTLTVKKGSNAVTDALTVDSDKATDRAATIDDAYYDFDSGDTITLTSADTAIGVAYIYCLRRD